MNSSINKSPRQPSLSEIGEKIDLILKYQKKVARIAIFRGIISFIFFLAFIVLPIIGGFYLAEYIKKNVDLDKIADQYKEFYDTMGELKETTDQISDLKSTVSSETIKKLINDSN